MRKYFYATVAIVALAVLSPTGASAQEGGGGDPPPGEEICFVCFHFQIAGYDRKHDFPAISGSSEPLPNLPGCPYANCDGYWRGDQGHSNLVTGSCVGPHDECPIEDGGGDGLPNEEEEEELTLFAVADFVDTQLREGNPNIQLPETITLTFEDGMYTVAGTCTRTGARLVATYPMPRATQ